MNNRGWGLRVMLGLCAILALLLIFVVISIKTNFENVLYDPPITSENNNEDKPGKNNNEKSSEYKKIENELIEGTRKYINEYYKEGIPEGVKLLFTIERLHDEGFLGIINDPKDSNITCSGYVSVVKESVVETYYPYLKCGKKYRTDGYNAEFDSE